MKILAKTRRSPRRCPLRSNSNTVLNPITITTPVMAIRIPVAFFNVIVSPRNKAAIRVIVMGPVTAYTDPLDAVVNFNPIVWIP